MFSSTWTTRIEGHLSDRGSERPGYSCRENTRSVPHHLNTSVCSQCVCRTPPTSVQVQVVACVYYSTHEYCIITITLPVDIGP